MSVREPPSGPRSERRRTAQRRTRRIVLGGAAAVVVVAAGAGAVVLRDDGDGSERTVPTTRVMTTTSTTTTTTTAPVAAQSAPADPATCLHGTYRLASQEYSGPIATAFGRTQLEGGQAGRTIELRPDGTFRFSDTGEAPTRFTLLDNNPPITGEATLIADSTGSYTATADTVTVDVTSLSGTLNAITDDGQEFPIPLPPDGTGVEETFGFTPNASYTCDGETVTVSFEVLTIVLERQ
ncbi:MAG: hypothetical protein ACRDY4_01100 [Acidimicrobiia bacterium]